MVSEGYHRVPAIPPLLTDGLAIIKVKGSGGPSVGLLTLASRHHLFHGLISRHLSSLLSSFLPLSSVSFLSLINAYSFTWTHPCLHGGRSGGWRGNKETGKDCSVARRRIHQTTRVSSVSQYQWHRGLFWEVLRVHQFSKGFICS